MNGRKKREKNDRESSFITVVGKVAFFIDTVNELLYTGGLDDFSVVEEGSSLLLFFRVCEAEVEFRDEGYPGG